MSEPTRIVVVEDEAVVAMDICRQLERLGYEVVGSVATADEAIASARGVSPDLVLMDIQLAGERDGIEAAEEITRSTAIPVVFLTAYADEISLQRAQGASPFGYIVKPFDEQDLKTTIEIALSRAREALDLQRRQAELSAVLDAQRQGAIAVSSAGTVSFVSHAGQRMLGRSEPELVGKRWESVLPVDRVVVDRLLEMSAASSSQRHKVPAELEGERPARLVEIELVDDPRRGGRFILFLYDVSEIQELRSLLDRESAFEQIIGTGKAMQSVFELIRDAAKVDSPVLIQGETGTGKELVARAVHRQSRRRDGPFVPVNCGGLSPELAPSQLFGHRRGAFTGAVADHRGFFAAAQEGTLLLDEIGELPTAVQPALLRALDDRQVTAVGETSSREIDFRLVAATSRPLDQEIERHEFRADLYYRLSVVRIVLPPLRERLEDLPTLVRAFLTEARAKTGKPIREVTTETMAVILQYPWPGNVRQLKNAIEFAVIRTRAPEIEPEDLPAEILKAETVSLPPASEADRILAALAQTGGNRLKAARLLGMSRSTLYRRIEGLGLKP